MTTRSAPGVLDDLANVFYLADQGDPQADEKKAEIVGRFRAREEAAGNPTDHLTDEEAWDRATAQARIYLRCIG